MSVISVHSPHRAAKVVGGWASGEMKERVSQKETLKSARDFASDAGLRIEQLSSKSCRRPAAVLAVRPGKPSADGAHRDVALVALAVRDHSEVFSNQTS